MSDLFSFAGALLYAVDGAIFGGSAPVTVDGAELSEQKEQFETE